MPFSMLRLCFNCRNDGFSTPAGSPLFHKTSSASSSSDSDSSSDNGPLCLLRNGSKADKPIDFIGDTAVGAQCTITGSEVVKGDFFKQKRHCLAGFGKGIPLLQQICGFVNVYLLECYFWNKRSIVSRILGREAHFCSKFVVFCFSGLLGCMSTMESRQIKARKQDSKLTAAAVEANSKVCGATAEKVEQMSAIMLDFIALVERGPDETPREAFERLALKKCGAIGSVALVKRIGECFCIFFRDCNSVTSSLNTVVERINPEVYDKGRGKGKGLSQPVQALADCAEKSSTVSVNPTVPVALGSAEQEGECRAPLSSLGFALCIVIHIFCNVYPLCHLVWWMRSLPLHLCFPAGTSARSSRLFWLVTAP